MADPVEPLILDLLEWIGPRLPVWEEANARGFVERRQEQGTCVFVCVTPSGRAFMQAQRALPVKAPA